MKKRNALQILLEIIVILGNLIIGITILTYLFLGYEVNTVLMGLIAIAMGVINVTEFVSLKFLTKIKSIQILTGAILSISTGITFLTTGMGLKTAALVWGYFSMTLIIARMISSVSNFLKQPLLNGVRIIISIVSTVFAINLVISDVAFLPTYYTYVGITLLVQFAILLVEFIIHRYQN